MKERTNGKILTTQEQLSKMYSRFEILLDHHKIPQEERDKLWVDIYEQVENNPIEVVSEIQSDWEKTFPADGNTDGKPRSSTASEYKVSNEENVNRLGAEAALNKWRRDWRNESFENSRQGGSKKARKKQGKRRG